MGDILTAAAEAVTPEELDALCKQAAAGETVRAYIGFEPSGTAHVGWMVCADMIQRLLRARFKVIILLADWHAQINDKLGGELAAIQRCGEYMKQVFAALGIGPHDVEYRTASQAAADPEYWALVVRVAKNTSLARTRRAMTILGRGEDEADADTSKFLYPAMQVADIFYLNIDLAYGGLDQRHAHMLARDVAPRLGRKPPVALHTPLVPSLKEGSGRMDPVEVKMSKSDPAGGILLHDTPEQIAAKLRSAHCPARKSEGNPVLDLLRLVVFPRLSGPFVVERNPKFGGPLQFQSFDDVRVAFEQGLHPLDLKNAVARELAQLLAPVRAHFDAHPAELAFIQSLRVTR